MVSKLVLDLSIAEREALDSMILRLSRLSTKPAVVIAGIAETGSGDLFITENQDRAMAAAQRGATVWTVQSGTGELAAWEDLPLALAFANGTLDELKQVLTERPELQGHTIDTLSWTRDGNVVGSVDRGQPIFATAGPDGETPQVFLGQDARSREREAAMFTQTLSANRQLSPTDTLEPGQTHHLTNSKGRRPVLKRDRFSLT